MLKKIFSAVLCLFLCVSFVLCVSAQTPGTVRSFYIHSANDLYELADNCKLDSYSRGLSVHLLYDVDLEGKEFPSIPSFSGTFYGYGHTISGLSITGHGSTQGLFRYLTQEAVILNLNLEAQIHPSGSQSAIGGFAGSNSGSILNCSFSGSISGNEYIGSIAGKNNVTGLIENCSANGSVHGTHFVGGIAGLNQGVIRDCQNLTAINATVQQNEVDLSSITIDSLTDSESAATVTDIGGIAGNSSGVIRNCHNHGNVGYPHIGFNIGGIAGTQAGYITECTNHGQIQGRKEVGGIVGQMEPVAIIEYSIDAFQILKDQLGEMSLMVDNAAGNAQVNAMMISGKITTLRDQTETAIDAVSTLIPQDGQKPDEDSLLAAQNTLSSTMTAMPKTLNGIASATTTTVYGITRDLRTISEQIDAMSETINEASENLGGTIIDISDQDTPEELSAKVSNCINYGSILADMNVGGITGAMATENDMDTVEDLQQRGEESLNFESQVRVVILDCENHGNVSAKNSNIGGITGWQSLGLIKNTTNIGTVDGQNGEFIGGISGLSNGFIRNCNTKCKLYGAMYVGGIAGQATIVTDCRTMVVIENGNERIGEIIGAAETSDNEDITDPIIGNFYYRSGTDLGAIDGISYDGYAQGLEANAFMRLEELSPVFRKVYLTFICEDGSTIVQPVAPGGTITPMQIPDVPRKQGYDGVWAGLDTADLSCIEFDMSFTAEYTTHITVLQSSVSENEEFPKVFVEGHFPEYSMISVTSASHNLTPSGNETVLECLDVDVIDSESVHTYRVRNPYGENVTVMISTDKTAWTNVDSYTDGSYLVFHSDARSLSIALLQKETVPVSVIIGGSALAVVLILGTVFIMKRRTKNKSVHKED